MEKNSETIIALFVYYQRLLPLTLKYLDNNKNGYELKIININNPWSNSVIRFLKEAPKKIILTLDDYLIENSNKEVIDNAVNLCEGEVGCIKLNKYNSRSKHLIPYKEGLKEYPADEPYALSTQIAVWDTEYLLNNIEPNKSIWEVENGANPDKLKTKKILWADTPGYYYDAGGCMCKGKIKPDFNWIKKELNIKNETTPRLHHI
jgi:hypothetical protein